MHMYLNTSWKIELLIIQIKSMFDDNVDKFENIFQIPRFFYSVRYKKNKLVHVENVTAMFYWFFFLTNLLILFSSFSFRFIKYLLFYGWRCFCCHLFWIGNQKYLTWVKKEKCQAWNSNLDWTLGYKKDLDLLLHMPLGLNRFTINCPFPSIYVPTIRLLMLFSTFQYHYCSLG